MNYQERVQALAEKMAKTFYTDFWDRNEIQKDLYIAWCTPHSRIAVAEMAEVVRKVLYEVESDGQVVDRWLIEYGLIPDVQEGGSDENI